METLEGINYSYTCVCVYLCILDVGVIGFPTKFMARLGSQPTANALILDYELFVGRTSISLCIWWFPTCAYSMLLNTNYFCNICCLLFDIYVDLEKVFYDHTQLLLHFHIDSSASFVAIRATKVCKCMFYIMPRSSRNFRHYLCALFVCFENIEYKRQAVFRQRVIQQFSFIKNIFYKFLSSIIQR